MLLNIFPYMDLEIARSFVKENEVRVKLWDDTENNVPSDDDYHLSIVALIRDRRLVIGDKIGLYWHPWNSTFVFSLFSKAVSSMADHKFLTSIKKTFFHEFISSKAEEEACQVNNTSWVVTRELVEIRDIYSAPIIDMEDPWQIKKKITHNEVILEKLVIPFLEMFEYILRYWKLDMAKSLTNRKLYNGYSLSCMRLFNDRGLNVGDEVGLYWDPRSSSIMFKLLSQNSHSKI
ncbi:hypothetical protein H5410_028702 [Solanum commersonii]|uniref:Uncharacterized protein n=1 Tax=Solanum commersonii TaxID=4109 RepID=A0A9J5Z3E9_SOLCO|nr:hypothetical protein H5410_028702 [Solanum commersonii]